MLDTRREERLCIITLNRPEKRNALSLELCRKLSEALGNADHDRAIGAILVTANGPSFCAGMDLGEMGHVHSPELSRAHEQLFTVGARITKPMVAAVQGAALAGGTGLAANAHVVFAAADSSFGLTEIRIGLWPFLIFRSVSLAIGERRTVELALTGRIFSAQEAQSYGLVHNIVEGTELLPCALETARRLSDLSPVAVRAGLEYVRDARDSSWDQAGELARYLRETSMQDPDFAEGLRAFRDKRTARWPSIEV